MQSNFDYLKTESKFSDFVNIAISAENLINIDPQASIFKSRVAMEFALKWMYSVDDGLEKPYYENLHSMMNAEEYRKIIGPDMWRRMDYIRKCGNNVAHTNKKLGYDEALLCLENLFIYFDFIACCYSSNYSKHYFDKSIIENNNITKIDNNAKEAFDELEITYDDLVKENASLKSELSRRRIKQQVQYVENPLGISEYETRKLYIDAMLRDVGWIEGNNWIDEVELQGMPNKQGVGYADYVLYDDAHRPLAVVEAKKTCKDVEVGRQQAKLYADLIEKECGRRPVIFLTNGFDTRIIDGVYPERRCSFIYSKRDLEKCFNLRKSRNSLNNPMIDKDIAGRYYQIAAIKSVCKTLDEENRRKALLVMATGSGKTRTVISLCKTLESAGWIKNVLFLADRNALVTQAKRSFVNLMPDSSCANIVEDKDNYNARFIFSTYQTMIHCIDDAKDDEGKLYTPGHFDLVICDEAHRSIYNKYKDIFMYFDAPLVGLTATPKDEIDKNTYEIFELDNGVPTFGYDLSQAVEDGFLVDYVSVESKLRFIEDGITYDELSEDEREEYENTFEDEHGELPESISSSAINEWVFNYDTIKLVLNTLMENGLKVDYGQKLGKTIIFAKNHKHAEKILEIFNKEYPYLKDFAKVIDNKINYSQSLIDEFSDEKKMPQIAISVDMLDTGIDVPEILNLVFFKMVMSKSKFWQMIGRGTRTCEGLVDGNNKEKFYIFDFCGNFEFFRMGNGKAVAVIPALQEKIFGLQFEIIYKLQALEYQTDRLKIYRDGLIEDMISKVKQLDLKSSIVNLHRKYVDLYADTKNYQTITFEDTINVKEELAPIIQPNDDEVSAVRFDALMYGVELAYLVGKKYNRGRSDIKRVVGAISEVSNIPEIKSKKDFITEVLYTDYIDRAGINEFEKIRCELRDLLKYIPKKRPIYETNFTDDILSIDWKESEYNDNDLTNYKLKAEQYIIDHQNNIAIAKLRTNKPLSKADVELLEKIMWNEIGTKSEYEQEIGEIPLGEFVREIVGLDMNAAKEAFAEYLNNNSLDDRQIYFVNQIIEYIVHNGMMKDLSVLQESPFIDKGSLVEVFTDVRLWNGIRSVIDSINHNVVA